MTRILGSFDPIANLWVIFATNGGYHEAVREPRGLKLRRAFNTRAQAAPKIRDRMVTAGDICNVRVREQSGKHLLAQSISHFDPRRTLIEAATQVVSVPALVTLAV